MYVLFFFLEFDATNPKKKGHDYGEDNNWQSAGWQGFF